MKKKLPPSLLKLLTTRIFLLGVTTLTVVMSLSSIFAYFYLVERHREQLEIHIKSIKNEFHMLQSQALAEASTLSYKSDIISILAKKNNTNDVSHLDKILKRHIHSTNIDHIIITNANSKIISNFPDFEKNKPSFNYNLNPSVAINRALSGVSGKTLEKNNHGLAIVTSMPVFLPNSDYRTIGSTTTMFHINRNFLLNIKKRIGHDIAIRTEDSKFITTLTNLKNNLSDKNISNPSEIASLNDLKFTGTSFGWLSDDSSNYMAAVSRIAGEDNIDANTHIMLLENKNIIWHEIAFFILSLLLSFIIIFTGASWLAFRITKKVTIPLKKVSNALSQLSQGAYPTLNTTLHTSLETMNLTQATENLATTLKKDKEEIAQAQLELIESETNLRSLAENASDGILVIDGENFLYSNEQAKNLLGYENVNALLNTTISDLVQADDINIFLSHYNKAAHGINSQSQNETLFIKTNGTCIPVEYAVTSTTWKGSKAGLIFFRDISERKQIEQELLDHREHLEDLVEQRTLEFRKQAIELEHAITVTEQANAAKTEFLSQMSHELRTPLNAIMGFGQLIDTEDDNPLNENQKDMADEIISACHHLLELINELLDLSRIESGRLSLSPEALDISEIVDICISQLLDSLATERGINIRNLIKQDEFFVFADTLRLRQVLINLLNNAVKYNKEDGTISINCRVKPDGIVRVEVDDTGIGIPEEKISKIFEPFTRVNANAHSIEGTGIGLSVCKRLIEAMDGTLGVKSQPDKGSTFWFELPATQKPEPTEEDIKTEETIAQFSGDKQHSKILCVEDNLKNQKLIKKILSKDKNTKIFTAETGEEGLTIAKSKLPDLILMDISLPGISGIDVLRLLKIDPATQNIPVIAISADAIPEKVNEHMKEDFSSYITKPFQVSTLLKKINHILKKLDKRQLREK